MPICSYLIQVDPPRVQDVQADLAALPGCTTRVSEDGRVIILVTDTPDLAAEADLQHALKCLRGTFSPRMVWCCKRKRRSRRL